ncbi:MAG TPA: non-homologous end-joining DNA ligase [Acidimicrobiales bacterium]|nr:non-homologous end-joining DNA ligase [Acidimicrobiales bacterium]
MGTETQTVTEVEGRRLTLTNLDKVLYPESGLTKADVINYYVRVAPVLLPHLSGRPVTFVRFPNGVDGGSFFEKRVPRGAPDWVAAVDVPRSGRAKEHETIHAPLIGDLPSLVWAANLAALELHVPLWKSRHPGAYGPFDQMVFDLDPGAPASVVECCTVARVLVDVLAERGLTTVRPKTSGKKGLQLYVALSPARPWETVREEAREIAHAVERSHGDLVVARMRKDLRPGKIFIDWSQNVPAKTTVAAYSLRAVPAPGVSTPVTMDEVAACETAGDPDALRFAPTAVLARVAQLGDLFATD